MDEPLQVDDQGKLKCSIQYTLKKMGGKWKPVILWHLGTEGTYRYNALRRLLPGVSHKVLTQQLKELETDGFIDRRQYDVIPPKVEYTLTDKGTTLMPILHAMHTWGTENGEDFCE